MIIRIGRVGFFKDRFALYPSYVWFPFQYPGVFHLLVICTNFRNIHS